MVPGKPRKRRRLTPKQRAVMSFVLDHPDATLEEIGIACGLSRKWPTEAAFGVLNSKGVQQRMSEAMDRRPNLQDEALMEKLEEGLRAEQKHFFASFGKVRDTRTTPDHSARKGYLELALKVKGAMKEQRELTGAGGSPLVPGALPPAIMQMSKAELIAFTKATNP